ncbi:MAG TPA: DNA-processing protein DprA [Kineosporiaceae bacterium]|nr:DNA-processing protein DprA [Kineosporiaceae bacterium]
MTPRSGYSFPDRDDGARDDGARDGSARDDGARDGSARDGSARDGSARDGSARDGGARDGRARDADQWDGDERVARAAWSRLAEPGDIAARELVEAEGAAEALAKVRAGRGEARWQARLPDLDPGRDLATLRRFGGRLLIPADEEWPAGLAGLGLEAPFCLWVRGPLSLATATTRSAAIVGARASTAYGERVATELADGCANRGITVVSGAAYGIDGAAHRGALAAGGPTIAVLACGVERPYPRGHEQLIDRIIQEGAVVTEVPPGSSPTRWRFIERNRLIAALSRATVVVEAAHRSGAIGTAARADKLSLPVAAVPGPVTSPASYGCHRLLRKGAICVTEAAELAELCGPIGEYVAEELPIPGRVQDGLDPRDLRVFDALPLRKWVEIPSLAKAAGLEPESVFASLGRLELRRLAVRENGGWRRAPNRAG